ncbi:MAG: ATP-binding cassette domain-containing protein [Armatimonadetes bacterium]|nr:ATP-binding cassette domain-containing protein [Armatimonadota bacterium]
MANIIEVEDLHFRYRDGTEALRGLSLSIRKGSRVAILGPNGAGKSTLLLHLNGIYLPARGKVRILGREITAKTERWVKSKVGLVFQDPDDQVFSSSVWEDVSFGPINMNLSAEEVRTRVEQALRAVQMEEHKNKAPYHLSYGQKKRVAIAGVLAMEPEIIVLDEPMGYLDPRGKDNLLAILNELHRREITIVIATHDVDLAAEWADRVIIMKNGRTLAEGDTSLLADEELVRAADLRFPVVVEIFRRLPELNLNPLPKTISEAVEVIRAELKHASWEHF